MDAFTQHRDLYLNCRVSSLSLKNRIVMAPLTRSRADKLGVVGDMTALYYAQRASAGLIISEAIAVSPDAHGYAWTPGLYRDDQIHAWRQVTRAVHRNGGRIFAQLWHGGRIGHPTMLPGAKRPAGPSAVKPRGQAYTYHGLLDMVRPRALLTHEIPYLVTQFAEAADAAIEAGFDGVEIHAANGYLVDQFLRDGANRRVDAYGGSIERRCRFPLDVVAAVANQIGPNLVGVRISPLNPFNDIQDSQPRILFRYFVGALSDLDIAYLHVIEDVPQFSIDPNLAFDLDQLRPLFSGAYMVNGGYDARRAEMAIDSGRADFVSFGRPFIANPDLVERFRLDAPIREANADFYYDGGPQGYVDYPSLGAMGQA